MIIKYIICPTGEFRSPVGIRVSLICRFKDGDEEYWLVSSSDSGELFKALDNSGRPSIVGRPVHPPELLGELMWIDPDLPRFEGKAGKLVIGKNFCLADYACWKNVGWSITTRRTAAALAVRLVEENPEFIGAPQFGELLDELPEWEVR